MTYADFGFKKVTKKQKNNLVNQVFSSVAGKYDLMNDVMSLGLHRLWKRRLISQIYPQDNLQILDMAGGTGDIAFAIAKKFKSYQKKAEITVADYNQEMLAEGKKRQIDLGLFDEDIKWRVENGEKTKFKAKQFDYYIISYGIRNFADIEAGLNEAYRILKPGGVFLCLEFSAVENKLLKELYDFYSFKIIPKCGKMLVGDESSYQYFVESIRKFPKARDFVSKITDAGFSDASYQDLSFGITSLYKAVKK
jgi:demethylmenaquinone methyltransferase / 2-methoxy-6-polyprenyl-1,4-benzoquinol methylase